MVHLGPISHIYNLYYLFAIRKVLETSERVDKNDIHQVLAYADDVSLRSHDIISITINADVLSNACKDISLA